MSAPRDPGPGSGSAPGSTSGSTPDPSEVSFRYLAGTEGDLPYSQSEFDELHGALRSLARGLVLDDATADDLVQEAWLAALEQPQQRVRDLTAWLRSVVRNIASRNRRKRARREEMEERASRREEISGPDTLAMQLSVLRFLQRSVAELPEPFRAVVRLRFFEELGTAEIAERLDRPHETVKTQLARGIHRLRGRLDDSFKGGRSAWVALLARLGDEDAASDAAGSAFDAPIERTRSAAREPDRFADPVGGMKRPLWGAVAVVAAVLGTAYLLQRSPATPSGQGLVPETETAREPQRTAAVDPDPERTPATVPPADTTPEPPAPTPPRRRLEVVVVDERGVPVPGALVTYGGGPDLTVVSRAHCDAAGHVLLKLREDQLLDRADRFQKGRSSVEVTATAPGHGDSHEYRVALPEDPGEAKRIEIPLRGPELVVEGLVVDADGTPVPGAELMVHSPETNWFNMEDGTLRIEPKKAARADAAGAFRIEGLPAIDLRLQALAPGHATLFEAIPSQGPNPRTLKLVMPAGALVAGRLLDASGAHVAGARVWTTMGELGEGHPVETRTDDGGFFLLEGLDPARHCLFATHPAYEGWSAHVEMELAAGESADWEAVLAERPGLHIRLVNPEGRPLAREQYLVSVAGREAEWTFLGLTDAEGRGTVSPTPDGPLTVTVLGENFQETLEFALSVPNVFPSTEELEFLVGAPAPTATTVRGILLGTDRSPLWHARLELMATDRAASFNTTTDVDGAFVFRGATPRSYSLFAYFVGKGLAELARFELGQEEDRDLGVLELPSAIDVPIEWHFDGPAADRSQVTASLVSGAWMDDAHTGWYWKKLLVDAPLPDPLRLLPGHHQLVLEGPGLPRQERRIHLGSEPIQLRFGPDEVYPQRFVLFDGQRTDDAAEVAVFRIPSESATDLDALPLSDYELVHSERTPLEAGAGTFRLALPKGRYAIELYTDSGGALRYLFELLNVPTTDSGIELSLAPN